MPVPIYLGKQAVARGNYNARAAPRRQHTRTMACTAVSADARLDK
jgi:hypothetical protein